MEKKISWDCLHLHFRAAGYYRVLVTLQIPNFARMWIVLTVCWKADRDRKSRTEYSVLLKHTGVICWRHWISVPHLTATFIFNLWSWIKWKCCLLGYIDYMTCSNTTESSRAQNFSWWAGQCTQPQLPFLIHTLRQETFAVAESKPTTVKISEKTKRKISQEKDTGN